MKKNRHHDQSPLAKEISAILLFTISLAVTLSLFSYDASDPSFSVYDTHFKGINNLLGVAGSYTADALLQFLGFVSFLIAVIFFYFGLHLFLFSQLPVTWLSSICWVTLIISIAGILDLGLGAVHIEQLGNYSGTAGGFTGYALTTFLTTYLSTAGSSIILGLTLLLSLMGALSFSLRRTGASCLAFLTPLKAAAIRLMKASANRFRKPNQPAALRKKKSARRTGYTESTISFFGEDPFDQEQEDALVAVSHPQPIVPPEHGRIPPRWQRSSSDFQLPTLDLLSDPLKETTRIDREQLAQNSRVLEKKLADFGVQASVVNVHPGPVITMYELEPAPGVKINRIVNLADDLALALRAEGIRIVAPIPGKGAIGIEIPNQKRETVSFKEIIAQPEFLRSKSPLTLGLGKDISGAPMITDLAAMPHLLIAGTTGSGKSVFINTLICSLLFKALPSKVKLVIVDPKRSEFTFYEDIPHLLYPIVTDPKQAADVLRWAVEEMDRRYHLLARFGVRDIHSYNKKIFSQLPALTPNQQDPREPFIEELPQSMPWIIIVIDELASLMMVSSREVESSLARLAQMARAAGIHLLVATQRPSVDVITGTIKANFPARISFRLTSKTDSRIIIDGNGAESLLNQGDMLFLSPRTAKLIRIHGPYISDEDIKRVVEFLKDQAMPEYQELRLESSEESPDLDAHEDIDEKYREAVELVTSLGQASVSLVQRKMRIGYNRAARMIERMEADGIVGPSDGGKPRPVLRKMIDI